MCVIKQKRGGKEQNIIKHIKPNTSISTHYSLSSENSFRKNRSDFNFERALEYFNVAGAEASGESKLKIN